MGAREGCARGEKGAKKWRSERESGREERARVEGALQWTEPGLQERSPRGTGPGPGMCVGICRLTKRFPRLSKAFSGAGRL